MRWPFSFFGRGATTRGGEAPQTATTRREWASLPAIQRTIGESQLTAPTAAFVHSLAGTSDPGLSLERLGHHVSADGPPGLVSGLTRVETYTRSADLVDRPRSRREPAIQRRLFDTEETDVTPSTETHAEVDSAPEPAMASYAVVDEPVALRAPLTRLANDDATTVLRLAPPRPVQEASEAPAQGHESSASATDAQVQPVAAQRLTLGQSRRLGLGVPLSHRPNVAVQRSIDSPSLDLAPPARVVREDHGDAAHDLEGQGAEAEIEKTVTSTSAGIAPIAGATVQPPATLGGTADQAGAEPSLPLPTSGPALTPPLTLGRPAVQRVVTTALPPLHARPAVVPTAPIASDRPPLPIVRRTTDPTDVGGRAQEPVALQRLPVVAPAEPLAMLPRAEARAAAAPAQQAAGASPRSLPSLPPLAPLAPLALLAPSVQRAAGAPQDFVAFSPFVSAPHTVHGPASRPEAPAVQREVAGGEVESEPAAAPAPAPSAVPGAAAAPGEGDRELDDLARKLHDRISFQLRRELLIQRERAGMVTDLR